jgi:hypothetical protein
MEAFQTALDPRMPDVRLEIGLARAEVARRAATRAHAEQLSAISASLREAREFPELYLGPSFLSSRDAAAFAERAAIADIAVRLSLSEQAVRAQAHEADTLRESTPKVWHGFREGDVSAANAATVASLVVGLTDPSTFDDAVLEPASILAPARFRQFARALRERLVDEPATVRHKRAAEARRVVVESDVDGMAWLHAYLPADAAYRAKANVDRMAKSLSKATDETRTLAQLRADVTTDLLAGILGAKGSVGVTVGVTVPVLTLHGGDESGILEGHGPIDAETARRLAAHAPSFFRILTHPVTSAILDLDRTTYKPPADLMRLVKIKDVVCTFAGCGRPASECDIDHVDPWAHGGKTKEANLASLCPHHHRVKDESLWSVTRAAGVSTWRSPTGAIRTSDPPPF